MLSIQPVPFLAQPHPALSTPAATTSSSSPPQRTRSVLPAIGIVLGSLAFWKPGWFLAQSWDAFGADSAFVHATFRFYVLLLEGILSGWLVQPFCTAALAVARSRCSPRIRRALIALSLAATCLFVSTFLITVGRHQFGAWDYNILIDVGWRQILGQRPFVDFITPTPPFFNLTAALAFRLFGVTWNANLYLCSLFSCLTLTWAFLLFRGLGMRSAAALGTSLLIQTAAMLTCCFWWYNNTTLVLAALFYLASLHLARCPTSRFAQISFVILLGVLPLTKPNIAGVTIIGCVAALLMSSPHRGRALLLTLAGLLLSGLLLLAAHVSLLDMIATYRGIARERGACSTFGFQQLSIGEQRMTWIWMPVLCLPLLGIWRPMRADLRGARRRQAAFWAFFPLAAIIAVCGIAGNGEMRDVECTLLIAALGLLACVFNTESPLLTRFTVALMCGMLVSNLYAGLARLRVYSIGHHVFFEWHDNNHLSHSGFLKDLHASASLTEVDEQVTQAIGSNPGPIFFGPRLDFEYATHRLPSPLHWASFFQPGTAFDRSQTSSLIRSWSDQRFRTLVFLKNEYTFYPDSLMTEIQTQYTRDDRYPSLSVYRRRPGS